MGICTKDKLVSANGMWEDSIGMSGIWQEPRRAGLRQEGRYFKLRGRGTGEEVLKRGSARDQGGQSSHHITRDRRTYLQIMLPRDLLWQGLICSEHAMAFHISGRHFLISRTGMLMKGIFMLPFSHSFMSFMAPWSDWALQLLKSSVGLKKKFRRNWDKLFPR